MSNDFDPTLLASGNLVKKGYRLLAENVGKTVAIITAIIAVLVSFTEIGFYEFGKEEITANMILITVASYIIYFSMEDAGERLGRTEEEYLATERAYIEVRDRIEASDTPLLREYCKEYTEAELEHRRGMILAEGGLTEKDFAEYKEGRKFPLKERLALSRAKNSRPIDLTIGTLLSERNSETRELRNPDALKPLRLFLSLIPSTLCTFFTVSLMLSTKDGLTVETVIESILKLSCLPIVALRGYSRGYTHAKEGQSAWLRAKTSLIQGFLKKKTESKQGENKLPRHTGQTF